MATLLYKAISTKGDYCTFMLASGCRPIGQLAQHAHSYCIALAGLQAGKHCSAAAAWVARPHTFCSNRVRRVLLTVTFCAGQ